MAMTVRELLDYLTATDISLDAVVQIKYGDDEVYFNVVEVEETTIPFDYEVVMIWVEQDD